jgi:hypothetical protein
MHNTLTYAEPLFMLTSVVHTTTAGQHDTPPTPPIDQPMTKCNPTEREQAGLQLAAMLGRDAMPKARRLYNDVAQAARGIFDHPPKSRATNLLKELRSLAQSAQEGTAAPDKIPSYLWPYIDAEDETEVAILCSAPLELSQAVETAIEVVETDPETHYSRRGGRHRDPRIDHFITILGIFYQRYTNKRPTVTFAPDSGQLASPFGLFVLEAFVQFYPAPYLPEGSIQGALKNRFGRPPKKRKKKGLTQTSLEQR